MNNGKKVTVEDFKDVKYGDLLAKFTELGVPNAWANGKKKIDMIYKAVKQLAVIKSLENEGLSDEQVKEELIKADIAREELVKDEQVKFAQDAEIADKAIVDKIEKAELTQDQIKSNLKTIEQNLKSNIPAHRDILQKKKEALLALLDD
jgi:multidrug resistance efflux pump